MRPVYQNESKTNRCFWTLAQFRTASSRYNWTALRHPQQSCGVRMIWMLKSACWKRPSPQDPHQTDGMCFVDLCIVFFCFFYGSLKLCIAGSLASGRWRQPWIRWPRATVRKESNLEWDPFHIELLLILPGTKSMQVPYTCKHCKPWFHSI